MHSLVVTLPVAGYRLPVAGYRLGKGKLSYWKVFESAGDEALAAPAKLGCEDTVSGKIINTVEKIICQVYQTNIKFTNLADLRWSMFTSKQVIGE